MIDWSVASPALVALFTRLAFDTTPVGFTGQWQARTQKYTNESAKTDLILAVRSIQDIGVDETDQVETTIKGQPATVYSQLGNRRVILEVRVESYKATDSHWCWATIERIRTRLRRPSSHQALEAINWALVDTGPSVALPMNVRGAEWSAASMDVVFGTRFEDVETTAFEWFERIALTSHVKDTDGTELPVPPNYTNKLVP
jgi:hypothetical protein